MHSPDQTKDSPRLWKVAVAAPLGPLAYLDPLPRVVDLDKNEDSNPIIPPSRGCRVVVPLKTGKVTGIILGPYILEANEVEKFKSFQFVIIFEL